ncbi:MAG: dihydrofolate reductase [Prochlorotrichaceae cyanobacterium]|jgi:dihydrofolate reductase
MISSVVAVDLDWGIAKNNRLPWHSPEDFQHFQSLTMGGRVVMGRKTWETLSEHLAGRENIVLTRSPGYVAPGAIVMTSPPLDEDLFVIGGANIYFWYSKHIQTWHISIMNDRFGCDQFIDPQWLEGFSETERRPLSPLCTVYRFDRDFS